MSREGKLFSHFSTTLGRKSINPPAFPNSTVVALHFALVFTILTLGKAIVSDNYLLQNNFSLRFASVGSQEKDEKSKISDECVVAP